MFLIKSRRLVYVHYWTVSSSPRCSLKKAVSKNFAIFSRKHLRWSLFQIKLLVVRPANLFKKTQTQMFFCKYCEISKSTYFQKHLHMAISEASLGSDCLELSFCAFTFKHPELEILQKYQSLSHQSFKHNLAHIPSLNLTPILSFGSRFCMFIINGYDRKSKRKSKRKQQVLVLQVPGLLGFFL